MAFIDYYKVLNVSEKATPDDIKIAFKKQAMKWHPDRNNGIDTIAQMQAINEAYLILKDFDARLRYNKEYQQFKQYQAKAKQETNKPQQSSREETSKQPKYEYTDYSIHDDILKTWMENAKRQAVDLARQSIEDFKNTAVLGFSAFASEFTSRLVLYIVFGAIVMLLFKICN